ncbi:uncharacterized protein HKW66_Vig0130860 [Vigna angularis]|uniref:Plant bHLH transcription factor ACT-like domain-containing protein n=1 Tax=Phaseolus angularis TaxID=3914 RepID=A0A8T0K505_PHAAN|nr:uncharacterized protein HKW66_Vig0130860 [Vigna angularis]
MVSKEQKRAALHEQLQHLRSLTNSHAVTVETLEKGFLINVYSAKGCSGLLVSILEVFEEMRLTVLEARVSCTDTFRFQAVGENEEERDTIDAHTVKEAVGQAIKNWSKGGDEE